MPEFSIITDKSSYEIGDAARIEVRAEWGDPTKRGSSDLWATVTIEQKGDDGNWGSPDQYPDFPLHELGRDGPTDLGWICHAIQRGRWGHFRARAVIFEPERSQVGEVETHFSIENA